VAAWLVCGAAAAAAQEPSDPTVMDKAEAKLACGPAVIFEVPEQPMRVVASAEGVKRRLYGTGDKVVIGAGTGRGVKAGQYYYVRRVAQRFDDRYRKRGEPINLETAGWVRIEGADETTAVATILHACDGVLLDDHLEPFKPPRIAPALAPGEQVDYSSPGRIVQIRDGRRSVGARDLFIMDRGTDHGIVAGARVVLFRYVLPEGVGPVVHLGEGTVITVSSETSVVLVDTARDAAYVGDLVGVRR
jgi:hypothetical protein